MSKNEGAYQPTARPLGGAPSSDQKIEDCKPWRSPVSEMEGTITCMAAYDWTLYY